VLGDVTGLDPRLVAQVRLNLARGLASLGEQRSAAEEFLRLADKVAQWTQEQYTHTLVACEAAAALAKAGLADAAASAYARAVASHERAPRPAPVLGMMREFARLATAEGEAEGLPAAMRHLAEADEVIAAVPDDADDFVRWYQRGATHYQRARCQAAAHAFEEALAETERAVAAYEDGGAAGEEPRAEAVRIAALLEANALGAPGRARARLTAAIGRCETAGLPEAAAALAAVRDGLDAK
jgi:tetratricopeptide (TPR) repeat protein